MTVARNLIELTITSIICGLLFGCAVAGNKVAATSDLDPQPLSPWLPGYLDIHHINTGRGDAAFFIFPDGTTMLFDAGDRDVHDITRYAPLKAGPPRPNGSRAPGYWIADYIKSFHPNEANPSIDYAIVSHFHSDHFGNANSHRVLSPSGQYRLSGFAEVAQYVPIRMLIDRAYPDYNYPTNLLEYYDSSEESPFLNYLAFAEDHELNHGLRRAGLEVGSDTQIGVEDAERYPGFRVLNLKANGEIWCESDGQLVSLFDPSGILGEENRFSENPLSIAIRVSYGSFDYYTGGDNTGLSGPGIPAWFDVETPMGEAVGPVEVMTLNHHGNRDATNENFLKALQPGVIIQQSWFSDHPGGEVVHRMASQAIWRGRRDIFSTNMAEETKAAIGPIMTKSYSSFAGHIVVRVVAGGGEYHVYTLDDTSQDRFVTGVYGPYRSKIKQGYYREDE